MSDDELTTAIKWLAMSPPRGSPDAPPPSADVEVEFGARSQRGPLRSGNDDHYLILRLERHHETLMTSLPDSDLPKRLDEYGYGMVVADGMGRAGEAASRLAISTLVHLALTFGRWNVRVDEAIAEEMMERAERFYRSVDATLLRAGHQAARGLETTMTAVYSAGDDLFFVHVGHARAYLFRDGELLRLTRDHTLARERPSRARMVDVSASAQDHTHLVTETLGGTVAGAPRIDIERISLADGDVVLLCTNGLTDVVDDAGIAGALRQHRTPDDQCGALVDLAASSGGPDDVTALVAHYRIRALSGEATVEPELHLP